MDRRPLPLDARSLLTALTARDEGLVGTYLDLERGELMRVFDAAVVGRSNDALEQRIDDDPDRYAKVPLYTREYRLMAEFVDSVEDDDLARQLDAALGGRNAFRRFDAVLDGWPVERARWTGYREDALARWAETWLRGLGFEPVWERPAAVAAPMPTTPSLVEILIRGAPTPAGGRCWTAASEADAQAAFVRACRELCELEREPFPARLARRRPRFVRGAVEIRREGATVTVTLGEPVR
ncbi:MAG: UPF0158 family protein [Myxococcota bacterium]